MPLRRAVGTGRAAPGRRVTGGPDPRAVAGTARRRPRRSASSEVASPVPAELVAGQRHAIRAAEVGASSSV